MRVCRWMRYDGLHMKVGWGSSDSAVITKHSDTTGIIIASSFPWWSTKLHSFRCHRHTLKTFVALSERCSRRGQEKGPPDTRRTVTFIAREVLTHRSKDHGDPMDTLARTQLRSQYTAHIKAHAPYGQTGIWRNIVGEHPDKQYLGSTGGGH